MFQLFLLFFSHSYAWKISTHIHVPGLWTDMVNSCKLSETHEPPSFRRLFRIYVGLAFTQHPRAKVPKEWPTLGVDQSPAVKRIHPILTWSIVILRMSISLQALRHHIVQTPGTKYSNRTIDDETEKDEKKEMKYSCTSTNRIFYFQFDYLCATVERMTIVQKDNRLCILTQWRTARE